MVPAGSDGRQAADVDEGGERLLRSSDGQNHSVAAGRPRRGPRPAPLRPGCGGPRHVPSRGPAPGDGRRGSNGLRGRTHRRVQGHDPGDPRQRPGGQAEPDHGSPGRRPPREDRRHRRDERQPRLHRWQARGSRFLQLPIREGDHRRHHADREHDRGDEHRRPAARLRPLRAAPPRWRERRPPRPRCDGRRPGEAPPRARAVRRRLARGLDAQPAHRREPDARGPAPGFRGIRSGGVRLGERRVLRPRLCARDGNRRRSGPERTPSPCSRAQLWASPWWRATWISPSRAR